MEENLRKIDVGFLNENGQSFFEPETATAAELQIEQDARNAGIHLHEAAQNEAFDFETAFGAQQEKWQARIRKIDLDERSEHKQNSILLSQIKRHEEKITSLNRQFIELFDYSESIYQHAENRRKEAEIKSKEAEIKLKEANAGSAEAFRQVEKFKNLVAQKNSELGHALKDVKSAEEKVKLIAQENARVKSSLSELESRLNRKNSEDISLRSSLAQGQQLIDSASRSMTDFQESFQSYLHAVEKDGVTPITIRAGKIFAEHWRIQNEDMKTVSRVLAEMTRAK